MKKSLLFLTFLILSLFVKAQSYNWANSIGSLDNDYASSVTNDASGNVYMTGSFSGTVDFDPSPNTATITSGGTDIFIAKYDNNGNYLWAKAMFCNGQFPNGGGLSITTDVNGNVYITGYFQGTTDFDPGPNTATLTAQPAGSSTIFVAKYDNNGNYLWAKAVNGAGGEGKSITMDTNGNVYITGRFTGTGDFDPGANVANLTARMYYSVFIAKYDANGNYLWAKGIGSAISNYDAGMSIITDINNNVYVTGYFAGNAVDISTNSVILSSIGGDDIFIAKYDSNGNYVWAKPIGSTQNYEYGISITTDINSNVYITGRFSGTADFDPGSGVANLSAAGGIYGGTDIFIAKYTANGNYVWAHAFGIAGSNDSGFSIKTDMNGDYVYMMGYLAGTADLDPSSNTANLTSTGGEFLAKYDVNGNYIWAKNIGNGITGDDAGRLMTVDGLGNVYVTGSFQGTVTVDPGINAVNLTSVGNRDIFIVKYSPCYTVNNPQLVCGHYSIGNSTYTATGTYTNILQSVLGCDSVVITQLTVNPIPAVSINSATICVGSSVTLTPGGATTYTITGNSFVVNPTATTLYTVTGTAPNGCTNTAIATVSISPIPTVSINNAAICLGSSVLLTPSGANTYTISGGTFTVSPTSTTSYSVTGENAIGCVSNNTAIATVTVNPLPTIAVNSGSICSGQTFTLNPIGALTYTYSSGSSTISPLTNSTYTVTGSDMNGCTGSDISFVIVNSIPTIAVNNGSICSNETFTLNPSGANTYTYSSGTNTVFPMVNSTYTVTGTDVNGCVNLTGAISTVSVNAAPLLTVTPNTTLCIGTSTVLYASGAGNYVWSNGAPTASISVTSTLSITYTVTGTDLNNCSATQTVAVTVNQNCQDVWPGDANSDGIVDNTDVLELGLHFTQTGPARATTSNAWQSYFVNNWTGTISNGKNMNHSDCNGDGVIDSDDTLAIFNNYGLTHAFKQPGQTIVNPALSIVPDQSVVAKGNWGTASVFLGEASAPITNINGLAFTVTFDQNLIDVNSFYIEYPTSFINVTNQNLKFQKPDFVNGKLYTAITHTITNNVSGNGKIAVLHYKIKSNLTTDDVLNISITQVKQSDASGALTPLTAGTTTVAAIGASVGMDELNHGNTIGVYPNPANSSVTIHSNSKLGKIELISITGQVLLSEVAFDHQYQLHLADLANGVYFIHVYGTDQKVVRKKIVVQH